MKMTDPVEIVGKNLILCVCVVMLLPTSVWGKTVTADPAAGLQAAIDAAATGDTVYVPAGSWTLTGTVFINKSLTVFGHGFGSAITGNLTTPLIQITGPTGGAVQGVHIKLLRFGGRHLLQPSH